MMAEGFFIQRKDQIQYLVARLEELLDAGGVVSVDLKNGRTRTCLLYTSPSPRDS